MNSGGASLGSHFWGKTYENLKEFKFRKARFYCYFYSFFLQKSIKREKFHPEIEGNGICATTHFKIFPVPSTTDTVTLIVGQPDIRLPPPQKKRARADMFNEADKE